MRKLVLSAVVALVCGVHAKGDVIFNVDANGGEAYVVVWTNVGGGAWTWTNTASRMWYPAKATSIFGGTVASTGVLSVVHVDTSRHYLDTSVVTNTFGNVETNWIHVLTNSVTTYTTNTIATWTNSAAQSSVRIYDDFIKRGDILKYTSATNAHTLRIVGKR